MAATADFTKKNAHFVTWCENAIKQYNDANYADSVVNMRKSGEAACKIIVFYTYTEKEASDILNINKSYNELIGFLVFKELVNKKVINWLQTLQIYGNDAAH